MHAHMLTSGIMRPQVNVSAVDFGLVSYSYRYTKEFLLKNVCPITMNYEWRLPKDHQVAAKKEFTVSGTYMLSALLPDILQQALLCRAAVWLCLQRLARRSVQLILQQSAHDHYTLKVSCFPIKMLPSRLAPLEQMHAYCM